MRACLRTNRPGPYQIQAAIAVAEQQQGPQSGLDLLSTLSLDSYHLFHAARGDFLGRLGRRDEAVHEFDAALALATNDTERRYLTQRRITLAR